MSINYMFKDKLCPLGWDIYRFIWLGALLYKSVGKCHVKLHFFYVLAQYIVQNCDTHVQSWNSATVRFKLLCTVKNKMYTKGAFAFWTRRVLIPVTCFHCARDFNLSNLPRNYFSSSRIKWLHVYIKLIQVLLDGRNTIWIYTRSNLYSTIYGINSTCTFTGNLNMWGAYLPPPPLQDFHKDVQVYCTIRVFLIKKNHCISLGAYHNKYIPTTFNKTHKNIDCTPTMHSINTILTYL